MATVTVDIPGVGAVEANNAASESTLRELVTLMKGSGAGGGGAGGGGAGGGGGIGAIGGSGGTANAASKALSGLSGTVGVVGKGLGLVAAGAGYVVGGFTRLAEESTKVIDEFANVGDSLTSAAQTLNHIPIVGGVLATVFGAVAGQAEAMAQNFQQATASGADFGGSVSEMTRSASAAGMTLDAFAGLIAQNGEAMVALGSTTTEGARRFATLSRSLRTSSDGLYALGFSTESINEGLANYARNLRLQGMQNTKNNDELVSGTQDYLKEMDALAKITGQERKAKEAERERLLKDAQFQASMAGLNEDVRKSFGNLIGQMPTQELGDFAKDILATGTATSEESQKLMAQMPESAAMLQDFHSRMQRGEKISDQERNALNNLMQQEGARNLQRIKTAGAAVPELAGVVNSLTATSRLQRDAVLDAANAQGAAKAGTDGFNEQINAAKQQLAEFSNGFKEVLATSGLIPHLMDMFGMMATVVQTLIVPMFRDLFVPAFQRVSDGIMNFASAIWPMLEATVLALRNVFESVVTTSLSLIEPFQSLYLKILDLFGGADFLGRKLLEVGDYVSGAFEFLGEVVKFAIGGFIGLIDMVTGFIANSEFLSGVFKGLGDAISTTWDTLRTYISKEGFHYLIASIKDGFDDFFNYLATGYERLMIDLGEAINTITFGAAGLSEEEAAARRRDLATKERMRNKTEAVEDEQIQLKKIAAKVAQAEDEARIHQQHKTTKTMEDRLAGLKMNQREEEKIAKAVTGTKRDYSDPLQTLLDEATAQGSGFVKDKLTDEEQKQLALNPQGAIKDKRSSVASVDAGRDSAITQEQEMADADSTKQAAETAAETVAQSGGSSASDQLNTNINQLIRLMAINNRLQEDQLRAVRGMTGDLFQSV